MSIFRKILGGIICMATLFTVTACGGGDDGNQTATPNCNLKYATYNVTDLYTDGSASDNLDAYVGKTDNLPAENGVILSPYYTLKLNGEDVPVYASRTASCVHSFAMIDVEKIREKKSFYIDVEINARELASRVTEYKTSVTVLPESKGVKANISTTEEGTYKITARLSDYGSYSFAFKQSPEEALTLMIAKKEDTSALFGDYTINYIEPGDHSEDASSTNFKDENTVYYFKAGKHKTDSIKLSSNTILYLDRDAYVEVMPSHSGNSTHAIQASGSNIKVAGRGLIDFSACCGSDVPGYSNNKGGLVFNSVYDVSFSGITVINSQTWTLCMNACVGVQINNCMFFNYRTYSDGIMLSDCQNAVVEYNFMHTGDDAFETKSTTSTGRQTQNVVFRYNAAWTDKAVAYGCIYESNYDTEDVKFENNSVGFAMGTWSNHLGCCVIQMGNRQGAMMKNITFENMEVYYTANPGLLNVYIGGSGGAGKGYGTVNNIRFKNVTAKYNMGSILHLQTYDSADCFIKHLYLDNIVSNGTLLTKDNMNEKRYGVLNVDYEHVAGGYDADKYLHINTKTK